ncbi:MAG: tRNA (guanine(10)-N(2))-dimethyltransferase [Candidatus Anstonellales archaeon]
MKSEEREEEGARFFISENVFYNPHMELSRTLSSLLAGALGEKLRIVDGMAASGIRGMRYKMENKNVEKVAFVDVYDKAIECIKKGLLTNKIRGNVFKDDINRFLFNSTNEYNFIELDPFGTPVPHVYFAVRAIRNLERGYLSVTATDTAVLCGAHKKACLKNYHSLPVRNYMCHETGLRILINFIARIAHEFNFGIKPLLSFYYRHQMKTIIKFEKGAKNADENLRKMGWINFCPSCLNITHGRMPDKNCSLCGTENWCGGEVWLGGINDKNIIKKMIELNKKRKYKSREYVDRFLLVLYEELSLPYFFDTHEIAKTYRVEPPKTEEIIKLLKNKGFEASRTHFSPTGFKTDASIKEILSYLK